MALTVVSEQLLPLPSSKRESEARACAMPLVRLTPMDRLALEGVANPGDLEAIVAHTEQLATALAGPDRNDARLRLVSRAVASERARMVLLEALHDERLQLRDLDGAAALDRLMTTTTKRLSVLLAEHRASCSTGRPTVVVGHADAVHVDGSDR